MAFTTGHMVINLFLKIIKRCTVSILYCNPLKRDWFYILKSLIKNDEIFLFYHFTSDIMEIFQALMTLFVVFILWYVYFIFILEMFLKVRGSASKWTWVNICFVFWYSCLSSYMVQVLISSFVIPHWVFASLPPPTFFFRLEQRFFFSVLLKYYIVFLYLYFKRHCTCFLLPFLDLTCQDWYAFFVPNGVECVQI